MSTLYDPTDCTLPGSSVRGILQVRILEWVAMPSSRGSSQPRDWTLVSCVSCIGRRVLYHWCHLGRLTENIKDPPRSYLFSQEWPDEMYLLLYQKNRSIVSPHHLRALTHSDLSYWKFSSMLWWSLSSLLSLMWCYFCRVSI